MAGTRRHCPQHPQRPVQEQHWQQVERLQQAAMLQVWLLMTAWWMSDAASFATPQTLCSNAQWMASPQPTRTHRFN